VTYTPDAGYLGADSFTYMATNAGGVSNTATAGITITDASAPSISIITPANGATYTEGQVINADYSCTDPDGSANVTKCTGPVASGTPLDTSTAGAHSFTVSASDVAGNGVSQTVQYTVASAGGPGASTPTIDTSRAPSVTASAGTVLVAPGISVSCPAGGDDCTADERATVSLARAKHTTIAVGKARVTIHAGSDRSLTLRLNRRGARLLRQHRRLRITVTVIARVGTNAPTTTIKTITIKPPSRKAHHSRVSRRL
jgi:hypothetical protein